jgi:hypothetical protein
MAQGAPEGTPVVLEVPYDPEKFKEIYPDTPEKFYRYFPELTPPDYKPPVVEEDSEKPDEEEAPPVVALEDIQ